MTGNIQNPYSKTRGLKARNAGMFLISTFCCICLSRVAVAQGPTYSADSLMAAFEKGSKISLKGNEITFTDVVIENKKSKVIFKSSENGRVVCELVSPMDNRNVELAVGSPLTVVGKPRGRGIFGNVTLDECRVVTHGAIRGSSDAISPELATTETADERSDEATEKPLEATDAASITPAADAVPARRFSPARLVHAPAPGTSAILAERPCSQGREQQNKLSGVASNSTRVHLVEGFYPAVAVLSGLALLVLVKLRRAFIATRFGASRPSTEEIRRSALAALLSEKKKS